MSDVMIRFLRRLMPRRYSDENIAARKRCGDRWRRLAEETAQWHALQTFWHKGL